MLFVFFMRVCVRSVPEKEVFSDWAKQESGCERREPAADAATVRGRAVKGGQWVEEGSWSIRPSIRLLPRSSTGAATATATALGQPPRSLAHAPTTASPATSATRHSNGTSVERWPEEVDRRSSWTVHGSLCRAACHRFPPLTAIALLFFLSLFLRSRFLRQPLHRACPSLDSFVLPPLPHSNHGSVRQQRESLAGGAAETKGS